MQLNMKLDIAAMPKQAKYTDNILLIGSCFTEHIADRLLQHKFKIVSNPHGILFNPLSVANSLNSYINNHLYTTKDLFYLNEIWNSWEHHTRFSNIDAATALNEINISQANASEFIKKADYLIITLGSAFQYYLKETGKPVSNNHRAPSQWFEKKLLTTNEIIEALSNTLQNLFSINNNINVIFTISPVRHIRDGVVENNRSKGRLIEAVHSICEQFNNTFYFPAYELVIDILRDYRFYDIDFVHPNYMATTFVWEEFIKTCIQPSEHILMKQVQDIVTARSHRPRFPETTANKHFKENYRAKISSLLEKYPFLDFIEEMSYFECG